MQRQRELRIDGLRMPLVEEPGPASWSALERLFENPGGNPLIQRQFDRKADILKTGRIWSFKGLALIESVRNALKLLQDRSFEYYEDGILKRSFIGFPLQVHVDEERYEIVVLERTPADTR